ncbi:hypothetical protein ABZW18_19225 [Streptomyces sp. NPDC004647]|uniref:hypothetical protein n=1 Tax=Streptomyces sp. NPDC004647 TaxID=3154671 RepID=UPI0033B9C18A
METLRSLRDLMARTETAAQAVFAHGPRRLAVASTSPDLVHGLTKGLDPFLPRAEPTEETDVRVIALAADPGDGVRSALAAGTETVVDASLYPTNTPGRRTELGQGAHAVLVDRTRTVCLVLPREGTVCLLQPDEELLTLDTQRLVKGLATILAEAGDELVVHASAVVTPDGDALLFPGDSRNGKTTVLLHTLAHFEVAMLSCDTTFLRVDDEAMHARGWPSNFSLSTGTMHDFGFLRGLMTPRQRDLTYRQAWDIYPKEVLDTRDVLKAAGASVVPEAPVRAVVFLNFDPDATTRIRPVTELKEIRAWIEQVCLGSRDPLYPNWHGYREVPEEQLDRTVDRVARRITDRLPVYQMDWAPGPDQLLRHVDLLDAVSHHRTRGAAG